MTQLREGTSLCIWPRAASVSHPQLGVRTLPDELFDWAQNATARGAELPHNLPDDLQAFTEHSEPGPDAAIKDRLLRASRRYSGWLPGLWQAHGERIEAIAELHATRAAHPVMERTPPTLPVSILRRLLAIEAISPARIFIEDDVDGLSAFLPSSTEIWIDAPHSQTRTWLSQAVAGDRLCFEAPNAGEMDCAIISLGAPDQSAARIAHAAQLLSNSGKLFVRLRAPWEENNLRQCRAAGFRLVEHYREIDYPCFPGEWVSDGAGDIVVMERAEQKQTQLGKDRLIQPYLWIDFDALSAERLNSESIEHLVETISQRSTLPEQMRSVVREDERDLVCWYDRGGSGFTAELRRNDRHLLVTLMPFAPSLEYVVMSSVFDVLGGSHTRVRPNITTLWKEERIVG